MCQTDGCFPVDLRRHYVLTCPQVPISLHCKRLSATRLPVDEDGGVEAKKDLSDQEVGPGSPEDALLGRGFIENLVEDKALRVVVFVCHSVRGRV